MQFQLQGIQTYYQVYLVLIMATLILSNKL